MSACILRCLNQEGFVFESGMAAWHNVWGGKFLSNGRPAGVVAFDQRIQPDGGLLYVGPGTAPKKCGIQAAGTCRAVKTICVADAERARTW